MDATFEVKDLLLAAFLEARGHRRSDTLLDDRGYGVFVFPDGAKIKNDAKQFIEDAEVPVRTLARNISRLRRDFREMKRNGGMKLNGDRNKG